MTDRDRFRQDHKVATPRKNESLRNAMAILYIGVSGLAGIYGSRFIEGTGAQVAGGVFITLTVFGLFALSAQGIYRLLN